MLRTRAPSVSLSLPGPDNFEAQLQRLQAERAATERAYLAQLAAYDAAVQRLLAQQQRQRQQQQQQRPKPSYIARLPPELLSEIAYHVSGAGVLPLLLVCKHWKNTLESTPSLWASLSLPAQPTAASLRALRRHLELAKAAPLAVRVHAALCAPQHLQSYWAGMALLRGALARVRSLEIGVKDRAQLADVLAHLSSSPAPALRELVLHGPHGEPLHPAHVPPDVLRGAPLERMVLDHACVPADQLVRPGIMMPLRELDVTTVFHDALGEGSAFTEAVERVAPTLERLRVVGSQWRADPAPRASLMGLPVIEAPVLRELSLDNAPLQGLVGRLSAPALRVVSLRAVVGLLDVSLLLAAAAALEELSLVAVSLQLPASSVPLYLPRLATLTLKIDNAAPFLSSLAVPALHTADIRQPDGASEDSASFLAAVDAFLLHAPGLQSLTLRAQHQSAKDAPYTLNAPCPSLKHLHLLDSDACFVTGILPSVHDLKLTGGSPSATSLIHSFPNLKRLTVHGVDADSVNAFLLSLRAREWGVLEDVEFEHCPMMDGAALLAAVSASQGRRLRDVQLWSCGGVSSAQREEIRRLLMR